MHRCPYDPEILRPVDDALVRCLIALKDLKSSHIVHNLISLHLCGHLVVRKFLAMAVIPTCLAQCMRQNAENTKMPQYLKGGTGCSFYGNALQTHRSGMLTGRRSYTFSHSGRGENVSASCIVLSWHCVVSYVHDHRPGPALFGQHLLKFPRKAERATGIRPQANLIDRFGRVAKGYTFFYGEKVGKVILWQARCPLTVFSRRKLCNAS